jgi:hypothetical protein
MHDTGTKMPTALPSGRSRCFCGAAINIASTSQHGYDAHMTAQLVKFATDRPFADPEKAARRLLEIASTVEPVQDGRLHIEKITGRSSGKAAALPSTRPASISPSPKAGCGGTSPGPS